MNVDSNGYTAQRPTSKRAIAVVIAAFVVVVGYFALGMPGMDHSTGSSAAHDMSAMTPCGAELSAMSADQFESAMSADGAVVVNVHVPYEGEIGDTDAFIPFDQIENSTQLPTQLDRPILLYCRTGRMSETAGRSLVDMGYADVAHLVGGMDAWAASGREVFGQG